MMDYEFIFALGVACLLLLYLGYSLLYPEKF